MHDQLNGHLCKTLVKGFRVHRGFGKMGSKLVVESLELVPQVLDLRLQPESAFGTYGSRRVC